MRRLLRWIKCGLGFALGLLIAYVMLSIGWIALHEKRDPMTTKPGRMVAVDGVQVHSQFFAGSGRTPILLVHGTAAWSGTWFELIPALQRAGYPVIAIDLPPFGYSDKATTLDFSREAQARRIGAVLDAYGVQRAIVVGHSFGGGPALEFVLEQPQRVERLVLVDAALGLTSPPPDASSMSCRVLAMPGVRNVLIRSTAANPLWSGTLCAASSRARKR